MLRILVDLTPVLLGGENGGAKIMALQLVKQLAILSPENRFILLATAKNFDELNSAIDLPNIKVQRVRVTFNFFNLLLAMTKLLFWPLLEITPRILSTRLLIKFRNFYARLCRWLGTRKLQNVVTGDLLFCPFTAPFYRSRGVPIVSVIYDLQSHYHPYFFTAQERYERKQNIDAACKWATKLVCISDYVKDTVIETAQISQDKIKTIHIRLANRLPALSNEPISKTLGYLDLNENEYLLYPANFWAHKNHQMLLTAFNIYRSRNPHSTLKLVCTGSDNPLKRSLQVAARKMGLEQFVIMPGYLSDVEFGCLLDSCRAVIFPSLYEGFGMPVLEAMAHNKPVLCSNITSLPEVTEGAALLFDPRRPEDIADAIQRIENEPMMVEELISLGTKRVAEFGTPIDMAKEYLEVFYSAINKKPIYKGS